MTWTKSAILTASLFIFSSCDFDRGVEAYRSGEFEEAHRSFQEAVRSHRNFDDVQFNLALTALRLGDPLAAEIAVEKGAVWREPSEPSYREFLLGNAAFVRCEQIEREASATDAGPTVFDLALIYAERAKAFWQQAVLHDQDSVAGRRNVERALLKIDSLTKKRIEAIEKKKVKDQKEKEKQLKNEESEEDENAEGEDPMQESPLEAIQARLEGDEIMDLLKKLAEQEERRKQTRRDVQKSKSANVERDW